MISTGSSAEETSPWYMGSQPVFERSYGMLENGKIVQKTESLSPQEVDEIIRTLSSDVDFISLVQKYVDKTKASTEPISDEEDSALGNEMRAYIYRAIEDKNLTLDYFFSFMIWLEFIQRTETGKIGVKN